MGARGIPLNTNTRDDSVTEVNFQSDQAFTNFKSEHKPECGKDAVRKNLLEAFKEEQLERQMSNREIARTHRATLKEQVMNQERLECPVQAEGVKKENVDLYKSMQSHLAKSFNQPISGFEDQSSQFSFKACSEHFRKYNSTY
jgi:hypothetical protein